MTTKSQKIEGGWEFQTEEMISDLINRKATPADLINFISTLRQSVLEEVSNGLPQYKRRSTRVRQDLTEFEEGFNDCLDQVTSLINNLSNPF